MRVKFLKAGHGDSIIISSNGKNILIDGGVSGCYYDSNLNAYGDLKHEIAEVRLRRERIDLLILTHIDNDHICGLLKWFEMDEQALDLIGSIWFNSGNEIAKQLQESINNDLGVFLQKTDSVKTGVVEAIEFERFINSTVWNRKVWTGGMTYETADFKIQILSPFEQQLKKLVKEYKRKSPEPTTTGRKSSDWQIELRTLIEEESDLKFQFKEDQSVKNGSSLAIILRLENKCLLLLGDAHPSVVINGLAKHGYDSSNPLEAELIKISHHGSNSNTSPALLKCVKTTSFFISTNSEYHGHPGKRTLARIIAHHPTAAIYFNYEHVRDDVFTETDRKNYKIKARVNNEFLFQ